MAAAGSGRGAGAATTSDAHAYAAIDLPDIRSRLIADLELPSASNTALRVYAQHCIRGDQALADPAVTDPYQQARLLVANELKRLRRAGLYWISPEMTRLCLAAAPGMPVFRPGPADLPSPYGLIYFALPLAEYEPWTGPVTVTYGDGTSIQQVGARPRLQVSAAAWGPWSERGHWRDGGTWFTFYTAPSAGEAEDLARLNGISLEEARRISTALPLRIDNECAIAATRPAGIPDADAALAAAVADPDGTGRWMHHVLAAFRLMQSARITRASEQLLPRGTRRRGQRAGVARPDEPVRLVDIAPGTRRPDPRAAEGPDGHRKLEIRFPVTCHWRQQYYPSDRTNRPIWIDEHWRGPEGAPVKISTRVSVLRQPGEPTSGKGRPADTAAHPRPDGQNQAEQDPGIEM